MQDMEELVVNSSINIVISILTVKSIWIQSHIHIQICSV